MILDVIHYANYVCKGCENVVIGLIGEVRCAFLREGCSNKVDVDNIVVFFPIFK